VISPTLYRASLQCERRAWLRAHGEAGERDLPNLTALLELRALLPRRFGGAGVRFRERIAHGDVWAEVDLFEPRPDGSVRIAQARATTQVRPHDVDTLLLPFFALRARGVRVERADLIHLNPEYKRGEGELDLDALLLRRDVRGELEFLCGDVEAELARLREVLALESAPAVEPSPHCHRPSRCEFYAECTGGRPEDWIARLPSLSSAQHAVLCERGMYRISEIPDDFPLNPRQARARRALLCGGRVVDAMLARALERSGPPAGYLDFETWIPCVPPYRGSRPLQAIPMQWSLHRVDAQSALSHRDFLAEGGGDPRRVFAERLLEAAAARDEPVLVYSSTEAEILAELEHLLPDLAAELGALRSRLVDLLPLVRNHVYDRAFRGSFGLKRVAAALCPGFGWEDLGAVREGADAARALARLAGGTLDAPVALELRRALLRYCERDSRALVELHAALRALARTG
jgi:hypothetical protein